MEDDVDLRLREWLATPNGPADEGFARRMERLVVAEERLSAARRAAWARFGAEMTAAAVLLLVFVLLARGGAAAGDSGRLIPLFSPGSAGLTLLGLWLIVSLRGAGGASAR